MVICIFAPALAIKLILLYKDVYKYFIKRYLQQQCGSFAEMDIQMPA
jgi:hypothetical protein